MQIIPILSYQPYVARPTESSGIATIASPARTADATASLPQASNDQTAPTDDNARSRAPAAAASADQTQGNESSMARGDNVSGNAKGAVGDDTGNDASGSQDRKNTSDDPTAPKGANGQSLLPEDIAILKDMQVRDREVRQHELAHQVVGGQFAGGASYTFERGPDGGRYAVAGEVPIDVAPIPGDPQATIEKMRKVRAAALAPAEPSAQDRAIAGRASQTMMAAQLELALQRRDAANDDGKDAASQETTRGETTRAVQAYESMTPSPWNTSIADVPWATI